MRPSFAWSRNSAPSLQAISRPALAASAWVVWTEVALSLPSRTTAHPSSREWTCTGVLFATTLELRQGVAHVAEEAALALPLVALLLGLVGLGLGLPGPLPLLGLGLRLGLPLQGAALFLLGLVAREGAPGLLHLALGLVHRCLLLCGFSSLRRWTSGRSGAVTPRPFLAALGRTVGAGRGPREACPRGSRTCRS